MKAQNINTTNKNRNKIGAIASIGTGAYLGKRAITSGLRRALGVRIETHTTNTANAKNIIKSGKILNPKYGGTGAARLVGAFQENSQKFVHITGFHKDWKKTLADSPINFKDILEASGQEKLYSKIKKCENTPIESILKTIYRKIQNIIYKCANIMDIKSQETIIEDIKRNFTDKKSTLFTLSKFITGKGSKTFYIGGTDKFFSDNFIPDTNDFALKSDKPVKVASTKIGAIFDCLKRDGLSGIKQNKSRAIAGVAIFATFGYASYKLIKNGIEKLKK
ncbi:MAG: hypothetical protein IKU37_05355 [Candidatus Gastranaerophilales bacterium]|nr:hypothetical protein [Candidatus Gastranaerophilales bacterium]